MKVSCLVRTTRIVLLALGIGITLAALTVAYVNWHGLHALNAERQRLRAAGEYARVLPLPPIPPGTNFMADPFMEMIDGIRPPDAAFATRYAATWKLQQFYYSSESSHREIEFWTYPSSSKGKGKQLSPEEVVASFRPIESDILRLRRRAADCPNGQMDPVAGASSDRMPGYPAFGPKLALGELYGFYQALRWRVLAELKLGRTPDAYADTLILCRIAKATGTDKTLLCSLVEMSMYGRIAELVRQGVAMGSWSEAQLEGFRDFFVSETCWQDFENGLRSERIVHIESWGPRNPFGAAARPPLGRGWARLLAPLSPGLGAEAGVCATSASSSIIDCYNPDSDRFDLGRAERLLASSPSWCERLNPYGEIVEGARHSLLNIAIAAANRQCLVEMYGVAIALELFRIGHRSYPARLDELVPAYLPRIPRSLTTGELPAYIRIDPGHVRLSSANGHEGAEGPELVWPTVESKGH